MRYFYLLPFLMLCSCTSPEPSDPSPASRVSPVVDTSGAAEELQRRAQPLRAKDSIVIEKEEEGHRFVLHMSQLPFDTSNHDVSRVRQNIIDGSKFYGRDGTIPGWKFGEFTLTIDGRTVNVPRSVYGDFYEPHFGYEDGTKYADAFWSTDHEAVFVMMNGSDGAGAYTVTWCLRRDGRHSRTTTYDEVYHQFLYGPR